MKGLLSVVAGAGAGGEPRVHGRGEAAEEARVRPDDHHQESSALPQAHQGLPRHRVRQQQRSSHQQRGSLACSTRLCCDSHYEVPELTF